MSVLTEKKKNKGLVEGLYPSTVWLSLTNKCNLLCTHCKLRRPEKDNLKAAAKHDISDKVFEKVKTQVLPFIKKIYLGGNSYSEQLYADKWNYFFDEIAKFPVEIYIITNGTLLTEERINKFIDKEITLSISIESIKRELYEDMRGKFYDKVFSMLEYACRQKKEKSKDKAGIRFGVTLFRDNIYELTEMIDLAHKLGMTGINASHFSPQFESQREQSLIYHKELYNRIYDEAMEKAKKLGIDLDLPYKFNILRINEKEVKVKESLEHKNYCPWPWKGASINHEGKVMPCCGSGSVMGDLNKNDFTDIWNGKKYRSLRETIGTKNPPDYCRGCITRTNGQISNAKMLSAIGMDKDFSLKKMMFLSLREKMVKNKFTKAVYYGLEKVYKKIF
ncbi:MAG: radical SAM protein [Armatimonadota bacterium]